MYVCTIPLSLTIRSMFICREICARLRDVCFCLVIFVVVVVLVLYLRMYCSQYANVVCMYDELRGKETNEH